MGKKIDPQTKKAGIEEIKIPDELKMGRNKNVGKQEPGPTFDCVKEKECLKDACEAKSSGNNTGGEKCNNTTVKEKECLKDSWEAKSSGNNTGGEKCNDTTGGSSRNVRTVAPIFGGFLIYQFLPWPNAPEVLYEKREKYSKGAFGKTECEATTVLKIGKKS